jgi:hypothetical protein
VLGLAAAPPTSAAPSALPPAGAGHDVGAALDEARAALARAVLAPTPAAWGVLVDALEQALQRARAHAPLIVREVVLVRAPHPGLGLYTSAGDVVDGRAVQLYVEVENAAFAPRADGRRHLALQVAGRFFYEEDDGTRTPLGEKPLGTQELDVWRTTGVHSFGVDIALSAKAPAGRYGMELVVTDTVSGRTATKPLSFRLR